MKESSEGVTKIHNVRFYNLAPRSINCFAVSHNKELCKLALARSDASIEIWDVTRSPYLEKSIPGDINMTVEDLAWVDERLFSVGLTGEIIEWDLCRLKKKRFQMGTGNAIWSLDVNKTKDSIVFGTEEGYLNIFDISEDSLTYKTVFDKQEGRILCCKFDYSGRIVVTGSVDAIRIWDTNTGHAVRKITLGRTEAKRETIVWCLEVLRDFTIISGDSRGQVNVWDGNLGVQIESHQISKVDVLTLALNEDEDTFVCSGIEPIIKIYNKTQIKRIDQGLKKWVRCLQRHIHDHDVKALVCTGKLIFSGGMDGYLGVSSSIKQKEQEKHELKHGPFLQPPCVSVSTEAKCILMRYTNFLEYWRLGNADNKVQLSDEDEKDNRKILALETGPEKLLELRSKGDEPIISSAISPDGSLLVYSTMNAIRIFFICYGTSKSSQLALSRVKDVPQQFSPSSRILFSSDSKALFLVKLSNKVDVFNIHSHTELDYVESIDTSKAIKDVINHVKISHDGKYFIAAGTCRTIAIWAKNKNHWKHYFNLPKYLFPTTALEMHQNFPRLVATFTDGKIFEYDLEELRFTCSSAELFHPNSHCVTNIVLDSRNPNVIILHNDSNLFVLKKSSNEDSDAPETKMKKIEEKDKVAPLKILSQKSYEHFVHLSWLSPDELVVIGVNPVSLIEQLPAGLRQKKFGIM